MPSLVFVAGRSMPMGSVSTWGLGDSAYLRAIGHPKALAEVACREGLLKKTSDGTYVDAVTSAAVAPEQVESLYRKASGGRPGLEDLAGPRQVPADHKTLTRHGGLIPESIRRNPAGFMGISPKDKMAGRAPLGMQLQCLTGALYLAGLGVTLPEIIGDPRRLSVVASSALPGAEKFVESARATGFVLEEKFLQALKTVKEMAESVVSADPHAAEKAADALKLIEATLQRKTHGGDSMIERKGIINDTMKISHILGSGVATVFANMIGPRATTPETNPLNGARTLGPEFHHTGECATFFGSVRAAALMLLAAPEYFDVPDMVLVGAAEAGFAIPAARILQLLFDSMGAMETTDHVFARGADLWTGYAPLTTEVDGFWPGEGAGMVGLTTRELAMKKGLRIVADLVSIGASADQGGKTHPAALGLGGYNSLEQALRRAKVRGVMPTYANLHGTGTPDNNEKEPGSLSALLQAMGYTGSMRLFADKALQTHALGAAGAVALSGMLHGFVNGVLPGAANLQGRTVDPKINQNLFQVSSESVRDFSAVLLRSQGFWGNNEDLVIEPVNEGDLERKDPNVTAEQERDYWREVAANDQKGAENVESILSGKVSIKDFLETVRFE